MSLFDVARRKPKNLPEVPSSIVREEIHCGGELQATQEARRRQEAEPDPGLEWIYLRDANGQWVARLVPRVIDAQPEKAKRDC